MRCPMTELFRMWRKSLFSVLMQQNKQRLISKISHEWSVGNFPSHTNHPDCVFVHRRFIFYSLPLPLCEIFFPQSEASSIIHFWAAVLLYTEDVGVTHSYKTLKMALTSDFSPTLHRLKNFHLLWRALKEPRVTASSQQQSEDHHVFLSYHANEDGIQTSGLQAHS